MERIQRTLMLLKPTDSRMTNNGINGGTLKLQSSNDGVVFSLTTDCFKTDLHNVYLFLRNEKERFVGDLKNGSLYATLFNIHLEDIQGAAVIYSDNGNHSLCLKSADMDWASVMERFRIARGIAKKPEQEPDLTELEKTDDASLDIDNASLDIEETRKTDDTIEASVHLSDTKDVSDENKTEKSICDTCPHVIKEDKINPFPSVFPSSEWVKISYPGPTGWWHYISGKIYKGSTVVAKVLGVPGEYGMAPPIWLEGFGTYMRCATSDARGYWLMFQDAETGEVLDMSLSPRGG